MNNNNDKCNFKLKWNAVEIDNFFTKVVNCVRLNHHNGIICFIMSQKETVCDKMNIIYDSNGNEYDLNEFLQKLSANMPKILFVEDLVDATTCM